MTSSTVSLAASSNVRDLLASRQIRQADLANVLGLSQPSISARLAGRTPITLDELDLIAGHLGVDVVDLLTPREAVTSR